MNLAGFDVAQGRIASVGFPKYKLTDLTDFEPQYTRLDAKQSITLGKILHNRNYNELAMLLAKNTLPSTSNLGESTLLMSILKEDQQISPDSISLLIQSGLVPRLRELEYLTASGATREMLSELKLANSSLPFTLWRHNNRTTSLAVVAAENFNDEALTYWLSLGVSPEPEEYYNNAMDLLPVPQTQAEKTAAINIFIELMSLSIYPTSVNSFKKLDSWLPDYLKHDYASQLDYHLANDVDNSLLTEATILKNELSILISDYNQKIGCHAPKQTLITKFVSPPPDYFSPAIESSPDDTISKLIKAEESLQNSLASSSLPLEVLEKIK